jgi:hypothetical protein
MNKKRNILDRLFLVTVAIFLELPLFLLITIVGTSVLHLERSDLLIFAFTFFLIVIVFRTDLLKHEEKISELEVENRKLKNRLEKIEEQNQ